MRITLAQSGGFAGLRQARTLDTASLPEAERQAVEGLVGRARFFDLPGALPEAGRGRDRLVFSLTVEDAGRSHTVHWTEAAVPPDLAPLVGWVTKAGHPSQMS